MPRRVGSDHVGVQPEASAIVVHRAGPHGPLLGTDPGCLPLETQFVELVPDGGQFARGVENHQVHDPLAGAARDRGAADVLDDNAG